MTTQKKLTIYKASAGSGKTFRLAVEYIKIVITNPENFRRTLAVTFTNKATEEMKYRIITHLNGIANALPDSDDYLNAVKEDIKLPDIVLRERARQALSLLIHNYHYFRIETIDSFFQRIFRNLSHELQLTANLRIELNDKQIEQNAVDTMIDNLKADDRILKWLMSFINEKMSEDKNWNVINQIKKFGENIFKQPYKQHSEEISNAIKDNKSFETYKDDINKIAKKTTEHLRNRGKEFFKLLESKGLSIDDINKKRQGICSYFIKLENGIVEDIKRNTQETIRKHIDDPTLWATKSNPNKETIVALAASRLCQFLDETEKERKKLYPLIVSCNITIRHLNELRLLEHISYEVRKSNAETGRFLLSDTQDLLHGMIDDSDSPFIYEKIGSRIEHIMIDEFQDTSSIQWRNFKVLLNECISHEESTNLIVGDVKQSIYRWRNGDWQLLNNIENEFPAHRQDISTIPLNTNWRSTNNIIDFNSSFFKNAASTLQKKLSDDKNPKAILIGEAYKKDEVIQLKTDKEKPGGYVNIEFINDDDYDEKTLLRIKETIETLLEKGVSPNDIAILVRTNEKISLIAEYLLNELNDILIVSDEAFKLSASPAVRMIVKAMHFVNHTDDLLTKVTIAKMYQKYVVGAKIAESALLDFNNDTHLLPSSFEQNIEKIASMPIYEMAEHIFRLFELGKIEGQASYVCTFFDELQHFLDENTNDVDTFLKAWNENIQNKAIQINENEGIRILSIHRSKGLEYDHVIIPFCDWSDGLNGDTLWCSTKEQPFARLPIIPVAYYPNQLNNSVYKEAYQEEQLQRAIDNLNLMYVAFTRAKRSLIVFGINDDKKLRTSLIKNTLSKIVDELDNAVYHEDADNCFFTWGEITSKEAKGSRKSDNIFSQDKIQERLNSKSYEPNISFKQSNESRKFMSDDNKSYIDTGNILHNMLAEIKTIDDIDKTIVRYEQDGLLTDKTITAESIRAILHRNLENQTIKQWFLPGNDIFNEYTLLTKDTDNKEKEYRPDRVIKQNNKIIVVDYKFARHSDVHKKQVGNYINLFREMGFNEIEGYVWYVFKNEIVKVEPENLETKKI